MKTKYLWQLVRISVRGAEARRLGLPKTANPYRRTTGNGASFGAGRSNFNAPRVLAWDEGWDNEDRELKSQDTKLRSKP